MRIGRRYAVEVACQTCEKSSTLIKKNCAEIKFDKTAFMKVSGRKARGFEFSFRLIQPKEFKMYFF